MNFPKMKVCCMRIVEANQVPWRQSMCTHLLKNYWNRNCLTTVTLHSNIVKERSEFVNVARFGTILKHVTNIKI